MSNNLTKYNVSMYSQKGHVTLYIEATSALAALHDALEAATSVVGEKIDTVQVSKQEEYDKGNW